MTVPRFAKLCVVLAASLLALPLVGSAETKTTFRLLTPFPGAVVHGAQVLLVFTVPPGQKVLVKMNDKAVKSPDQLVPGNDEDLHHLRLNLDEGRHKIRVLDEGTEAELGALSVTYIPSSSMRTATAPGDKIYSFHTHEREGRCKGCHSLPETFETMVSRPLAPAGKVCGACHPSIEKSPQLHGPVAVYECFKCHGSEFKPSRFGQITSQATSCSNCHQDFLTRILGGSKFVHGPVASGVCVVCHDPHGAKSKELLVEDSQTLCMGCHADTLPLPVEKGLHGKLPCAKCHDPHGAAEKHLTSGPENRFCVQCHSKIVDGSKGHPISGHPVEAKVDPSKPGQPMSCRSCHDPHGLKDISKANLKEDDPAWRQFCRRCHY